MGLLLFAACHKDLGPQAVNGQQVVPDSNAVIIVNEGNFQWANASIGRYNPDLDLYQDGLFLEANGQVLGDVIQEAHKIGGRYYLVMNGSNELIICSSDWKIEKRIAGQSAPYRLWFWEDQICLSDYYQSKLWILDLDGNLKSEIPLSGAPKTLLDWQGNLIMAHQRKLEILKAGHSTTQNLLNLSTDLQALVSVEEQLFLALADGRIMRWAHPDSSLQSVDSLAVLSDALVTAGNGFYSYTGDSIFRHTAANQFKGQGLCAIATENYYGLDWNAASHTLYLFDARQYVQPHRVSRIDGASGDLLNDFEAGALPNGLLKDWD